MLTFWKRKHGHCIVSVGILLILVLSCATTLVGISLMMPVLIVSGLFLIFTSSILLQFRFYREGDIRNADKMKRDLSPDVPAAPCELRARHLRAIWENMERTRMLMKIKEKEFLEAQRNQEKAQLSLSQEEDILFMTDRSWLLFWPTALLSAIFLMLSTNPAEVMPSEMSFMFLAVGLLGLLSVHAAKGRIRCYLTNFRVLVRRRTILGKYRWSALTYPRIAELSWKRKFASGELVLKGEKETVTVKGLTQPQLQSVLKILQQRKIGDSGQTPQFANCKKTDRVKSQPISIA